MQYENPSLEGSQHCLFSEFITLNSLLLSLPLHELTGKGKTVLLIPLASIYHVHIWRSWSRCFAQKQNIRSIAHQVSVKTTQVNNEKTIGILFNTTAHKIKPKQNELNKSDHMKFSR